MKYLFIVLAVLFSFHANGQTCTCESNFEWMKKTFEENDAGAKYIINKKGQGAYDIHNRLILEKIRSATTLHGCFGILYEWMTFFRSGHIGINYIARDRSLIPQNASFQPSYTTNNSFNDQGIYFDELNETTLYLRISSFDFHNKEVIEEVIANNKEKILNTENLIIDLRGNGGGNDLCYAQLIPLLYTNPIRSVGIELLSTPMNNQYILELSTNPDFDSNMQQWFKNMYDKMQNKLGEFVPMHNEPIQINKQDTVYEYPKNIGIIIDERCASTTEEFLLAAKQSKKVKLFGTTTMGALDVSNVISIESPCKEFSFESCLSKSLRIPGMAIDNIGLQPDFYLDKTIPQNQWVKHIAEILNQ